ncbi:uncharacterized protein [Diabrotica undecimpunctata]|uniref:uncharacterized protein n=1 Tax=Diabrotica undecimpunctata TaxID=50387 RepID=UPI003B640518
MYVVRHLDFQLERLTEAVNMLKITGFVKGMNVVEYLNDPVYQKVIENELKMLVSYHYGVKKLTKLANHYFHWIICGYIIFSTLVLSNFVLDITLKDLKDIPDICIGIYGIVIIYHFVFNETGENIKIKFENFYIAVNLACPWYQWNKENRRLLLILILQSKETVTLNVSGLIDASRLSTVKIYNNIYTFTTFCRNLK